MELLRTEAKVDMSHLPARGDSQFLMLLPVEGKKGLCITVRVEDVENFLQLKNGEIVVVTIEKK